MEPVPERHLDCSDCKKPISVHYTEIVGKMIYRIGMCSDCPVLRQKLCGLEYAQKNGQAQALAVLTCGTCHTSSDEVRMGSQVGCSLCYEVFEDLILQELASLDRLPQKNQALKKTMPLHVGQKPGQSQEITPAMKLLELHQALHDTLAKEDYEQAAWLRDRIKALTQETKQSDTLADGEKNA
jgi:protein arginine kinase activator